MIRAIQGTALDPHLICECEGVYIHPAVCEQPKAVCAQLEVSAGDVDKGEVRGALSVCGRLGLQIGESYSGHDGIQICVCSEGGDWECELLCARQQTLTREEGE